MICYPIAFISFSTLRCLHWQTCREGQLSFKAVFLLKWPDLPCCWRELQISLSSAAGRTISNIQYQGSAESL